MGEHHVQIPEISSTEDEKFITNGLNRSTYLLDYINFSVLHNPFRKFPYFTASNIHGNQFQKIKRKELFSGKGDRWKKDTRIPKEEQLGHELYSADKSDFDKGHLTKREDVQWGDNRDKAVAAAESTFFYTNAMPQVDRLNRGIWRKIEDYILHHQTISEHIKINLFTGPVFRDNDPNFVTEVRDTIIQIPCLFWKVIYYQNDNVLHRTAFLTSQKNILEKRRIVKPSVRGHEVEDTGLFMTFKDAETYQVRVDFIEKLSGLKFHEATEKFVEDTPEELILSGVNVRSDKDIDIKDVRLNVTL